VVLRCADGLLRSKTKDLTVLSALCVSLYRSRVSRGWPPALRLPLAVEKHSRDLYPRASRRRGRASAFAWLTQWLTNLFDNTQNLTPRDHPPLVVCHEEFTRLNTLLREEFGSCIRAWLR